MLVDNRNGNCVKEDFLMNKGLIKAISGIVISLVIIAILSSHNTYASATVQKVPGNARVYSDWYYYDLKDTDYTETNDRIASFSVTGNINKTMQYEKVPGYGVSEGNISFSLDYDGKWQDETQKKYLIEDAGDEIDGQAIKNAETGKSVEIGKGAVMVQKSYNGYGWQLAAPVLINVFEGGKKTLKDFYTTAGSDVNKGCFYRVIIAYRFETVEDGSFLGIGYDDEEDYKAVEVYKFFLCNNSGKLSIHNLSTKKEGILDKYEDDETGISIEALLKGETLLDGSATTDGFSIDTLGVKYKSIQVNGIESNNGDEFSVPGKYSISVTTLFDDVSTQTVYIYKGAEDYGFKDYFDDYLVKGNRVSRDGKYPYYAHGSYAETKVLSDGIPSLSGSIANMSTGDVIQIIGDRAPHDYELVPGEYMADVYSGNIEAGSVIHYMFHFVIIDEESGPYRNYYNLMSNNDHFWDLKSGHYEVAFRTGRGGHIYVCFDSEDEAFKYAYDIEKKNIEIRDDGLIYYTALDNDNKKVRYPVDTDEKKIEFTQAVNYYAKKNVERAYFDRTESFSFETLPKDSDVLKSLESASLAESTHVFPSEEEREKMIDRGPYLNGFTFVQEGDYDVTDVDAFCENNGKTYKIELGVPVDEQLDISSKYVITEKNKYGDQVSYDAYYMKNNETHTNWTVYSHGAKNKLNISADNMENGEISISADAISLNSAENLYDKYAIISILPKDAYDYELRCLTEEAEGLTLFKKGDYIIKFVDRTGNHYSVNVNISGNTTWNSMDKTGLRTYDEVYNSVYLTDKPVDN